jgi:hypothetical protein
MSFMHTRSDSTDTVGAGQDAAGSRKRYRDASDSPAPHQRHEQAAAAAEFERLRARLRQLVGTNNIKR